MTEERSPLDTALDLLVFAPVGMFLTLAEDLPKLVQKGKGHVESQLTMARVIGEMAAPQLREEATKLVKGLMDRMATPSTSPPPTRPTPPAPTVRPPGEGGAQARTATVSASVPAAGMDAPPTAAAAPSVAGPGPTSPESLAIPGYDSLSAMQVVQRLAGLKQGELAAVRRYEEGHRRRKTIINRADQLLAEAG